MEKMCNYKTRGIYFITVFAVIFFVISFSSAYAAELFVNPFDATVTEGDVIRLRVGVNTQGVSVNNGESTVSFPADLMQVVSIDTSSSIFDLWVSKPTFSNANGTISFNGGVANPGFTGSNGTLFWITGRAKKAGVANISLQSSFVRANDGLGTNVLSSTRNTSVTIAKAVEKPVEKEPTEDLARDVMSPDTLFIAVMKNDQGQLVAMLDAHDNEGVDHFTIAIGDREPVKLVAVNDATTYIIPKDLKDGVYILTAAAYDKAGNSKKQTVNINIDSNMPEITYFSKEVVVGHEAHVAGATAMPNTEVLLAVVYPSRRLETYLLETDESGKFDFDTEPLQQIGEYTLWIQKTEVDGVEPITSERITINVSPTWVHAQVEMLKPYAPILVGSILGIALIVLLMRSGGYRVIRVPRRNRDDF
jgi:hypothetical protein